MSGFLASVRSCAEARLALAGGADIIDVKEPSAGALGSVDRPTLAGIIRTLQGCRPVSATIGDVSLVPENIVARVTETAATGVDIVKIGIFSGDLDATLDALAPLARRASRASSDWHEDTGSLADLPARYGSSTSRMSGRSAPITSDSAPP